MPLARVALISVLLYLLLVFGLDRVGLLGPDEPRYASIGREMARTGDWVTPRLWGQPWFEKPALLYWMIGAARRIGLGDELAPRLPVALLSVAFLVFYFLFLRREFGERPAWFASAMLATSAGWLVLSHVGVTDLPVSATYAAAMLLALRWIGDGDRRALTVAGALLGVAALAKGLVPIALALPLVWMGRRRWRDLPLPALAALVVAAPWYILCAWRNGAVFLEEFFWKHHFERFASDALQHPQPFWFYVPVLAGLLYPWTPLAALSARKAVYRDMRCRCLLLLVLFGFVFFSASANKLPSYLGPLLPLVCALAGVSLAQVVDARWLLAASGALLAFLPMIGLALPQILAQGLGRSTALFTPSVAAGLALAALCWWGEKSGRRAASITVLVITMAGGVVLLKVRVFPATDRAASARPLWIQIAPMAERVCVEAIHRNLRYGLNYYSAVPLPDCAVSPRPVHVRPGPGNQAYLAAP